MATALSEDVQRIVREVIAQLRAGAEAVPAAAVDSTSAAPALARDGEVCVDCRVVTLESIAGRLQGTKQLTVSPGALVTPAVHDELRRKGVVLVRRSVAAAVREGLPGVLLVVGPSQHDPAAAVQGLVQEGISLETEKVGCMIAATDRLATAVAKGRMLGLLWTRHAAAAICLANRHAGVRAILATGAAATAAAVAAVGANVLIVDPALGTAYEKKQILRDFCLGGIRPCPESLRTKLE